MELVSKRRATAAIALTRLGQPERAWEFLKQGRDRTAGSYSVHRFFAFGGELDVLTTCLEEETDLSFRRSLMPTLGEIDRRRRSTIEENILITYRSDQDAGVHGAAEW